MSNNDASPRRDRLLERVNPHTRERELAGLAAKQHGLVTTAQLNDLGVSNRVITTRVSAGRLHRVHRGVFAVGHRILSVQGHRLAAVLACGFGALASHTTAAAIWGIRRDHGRVWHITTAGAARSRPGIRVHHAGEIATADRARRDGIPVTSLARSLVDLGDVVKPDHVRAAFVRAEQLRLLDMATIDDALRRATTRRGPSTLREVLRGYDPRWQATRSPLELMFLDALAGRGLPEPSVNEWIAGRYMVDFLWREQRVIVETDGNETHGTVGARGRDARRDRELRRLGFEVLHVPYVDLAGHPGQVVTSIAATLQSRERRLVA